MTNQQTPDESSHRGTTHAIAREPLPAVDARPLVILLVEDDVLIRMDAVDMLRELGHEVVDAEYGLDALAVLRERHIDVLVTDVGLPGMSGIELADRACQLRPGIGLIFATGDTELESRLGRSSAVIVCKPYDEASLADSLCRVLGQRSEQGPAERMCPGPATS